MDTDLELVQRKKNGTDQKFSTPYTLLDLDYDTEDIVNHLKELKLSEYSETKIDTDDVHPPVLCKENNVVSLQVSKKIKGGLAIDGIQYVNQKNSHVLSIMRKDS